MLVLGRESGSWDEMGISCDNVKPENKNLKVVLVLNLVFVVQSEGPYSFKRYNFVYKWRVQPRIASALLAIAST